MNRLEPARTVESDEAAYRSTLHLPKVHNLGWILIAGLLVFLPLSFLVYQAWFNPRVEFLVPSLKGRWILHSPDALFPDKLSGTISFLRKFDLLSVPPKCTLAIRAATRFRLIVNGRILEQDSGSIQGNWKRARTYDITPFLQRNGNSIEIRVTNDHGLPAMLIEAAPVLAGGTDLSSDTEWESASGPGFVNWRHCIYPYQERPVFGEDRSAIQKPPALYIYVILLAAYALFVLAALNPFRLFNRGQDPPAQYLSRGKTLIIAIVLISAVLAVNLHNLATYPYSRSYFDVEGHVAYVKYVAKNWRVPTAAQGWQMYQPPLYYFVSAAVYRLAGGERNEPSSLKAVQGVGVASGLACILFAWLILKIYSKTDRLIQLLGTGTVAFLPMVLYIGPTISNELFSAAMMSFGLYLLAKYGFQESIRCTTALLTGIVFGLALLSKYTAFLLFLVAVAILLGRIWIRAGQRRREMAVLLIFCSAVFAVSGWFYARNAILFKKPFVANWDRESGFNLEQPPGYRTLGFYARFGSVLTHTPERSRWLSFWDGYYGSMWMDTHFNMIDYRDQKANSYGTVLLGLALLPSAAILLGFAHSLKRVFWERRFEADFALVACVAVAIPALVLHTLQVPTITVLKAFFTLLLVPALAVFSGLGLREMAENLGRLRPLLYILLLVHFLVICALFWYRP